MYADHEFNIKVFYKDIDKMGVVYYSRYFEFFEQARTEFLKHISISVSDLETRGYYLPVIKTACNYHKGANLEDELVIKSNIRNLSKVKLVISYKVFNKKKMDQLLVDGFTEHCFIKKSNNKPSRIPHFFVDALKDN